MLRDEPPHHWFPVIIKGKEGMVTVARREHSGATRLPQGLDDPVHLVPGHRQGLDSHVFEVQSGDTRIRACQTSIHGVSEDGVDVQPARQVHVLGTRVDDGELPSEPAVGNRHGTLGVRPQHAQAGLVVRDDGLVRVRPRVLV